LSQGSVSDLLARPKPWHMLTQKGREPFIRMKMFLEDDNAVHKLVASQYKIAPDKLMRTGNYSSSPQIPAQISKQMPPMPKLLSEQMAKLQDPALLHMQMSQMAHLAQQHQQQQQQQQMRDREHPLLLTPPGLPPQHAIQLPHKDQKPASNEKKMMPIHSPARSDASPSPASGNVMRSMNQHISPTVYEMAALTQDLDTQVITTKIKEALLANNIGQKIFGECVLGLSQGSVSELLSKPKPWHMLSIKGREPFIRMQLWLNDANNVERLQLLKNERREAIKRRRSTGAGHDNSSDTSSNDTSEFYHSNSPGPASGASQSAPPNKKQRVLFSEEQKEALRLAFALDPYPNVQTIEFLANELNLSTRTITNWFHNHRMRLKQQVPHGQPAEPIPSRDNNSGAPFDPVQFRILLNQRLMEIQKERMGLGGMALPYPPYFAANPNLAALIGRGLLSGTDAEQLAALNNAMKEQMMGLDLSMNMKRDDDDDDFDQTSDNEGGNDDDDESLNDSRNNNDGKEMSPQPQATPRSSRRKPVAPQWLNPLITSMKIYNR
jgi:homeobox protein cut-like